MPNAEISINRNAEYKTTIDDIMKVITLTANKLGLGDLNNHDNYRGLVISGVVPNDSIAQKIEHPVSVYLTKDVSGNFVFDGSGEVNEDGTIHVDCPVSFNPDNISIITKPNTLVKRDDEGNIYGNNMLLQGDLSINGSINITDPTNIMILSRLIVTNTTDVQGNSPTLSALILGNSNGEHLGFDGNEIMAKSSPTTTGTLYLNNDGGNVTIGSGGLTSNGTISANTGVISGGNIVPALGSTLSCGSLSAPWNYVYTRYLNINSDNGISKILIDGRNITIRPEGTNNGLLGTPEHYWNTTYTNSIFIDRIQIYTGTTNPTGTSRLNANGYLYATRIYNAVYNDYAECFNNSNLIYNDVKNRIVEVDDNGCVRLATLNSKCVVGIVSDSYAILLNGSEEEVQKNKKIPVGLIGTLYVDAMYDVNTNDIGKFAISSEYGYAIPKDNPESGTSIGKIIGIDKIKNMYKILICLK